VSINDIITTIESDAEVESFLFTKTEEYRNLYKIYSPIQIYNNSGIGSIDNWNLPNPDDRYLIKYSLGLTKIDSVSDIFLIKTIRLTIKAIIPTILGIIFVFGNITNSFPGVVEIIFFSWCLIDGVMFEAALTVMICAFLNNLIFENTYLFLATALSKFMGTRLLRIHLPRELSLVDLLELEKSKQ
jgi:hypothetical protein